MSDRILLELAAKAAGLRIVDRSHPVTLYVESEGCKGGVRWNPIADDGDALRLAVKLNISVGFGIFATQINCEIYDWAEDEVLVEWKEDGRKDPCAATRRAIVRAAAEIGRNMNNG